jgi:multiple sugar transport system permease protein
MAAATTPVRKVEWGVANVVVIALALIPVLWMVSLSFKTPAAILDPTFIPTGWTWSNYKEILSTGQFVHPLLNSIGIGLIATFIAVVLASMAAYAVARLNFPGKAVLIGMALLIAMFPAISLVTPLFTILRAIGLYNTWPGLIIPYVAFGLPLGIYTLSAFFREIPWELEKAAKVDGATPYQAFVRSSRRWRHPAWSPRPSWCSWPAGTSSCSRSRSPRRSPRGRRRPRWLTSAAVRSSQCRPGPSRPRR